MAILMVTYHIEEVGKDVVIYNSQGDHIVSNDPAELLNFLGKNYDGVINKKMFWNLDTDFSCVLKKLGMRVCSELVKEPICEAYWSYDDGKVNIYKVPETYEDNIPENYFRLYYFRQTILSLQVHGEKKSFFYNLHQFFESDEEITDTKQIRQKSKELTDAFFSMGLNPMRMSSPISVFQNNVLEHIEFPTLADLPSSINEADGDLLAEWSEQIMHREWTSAFAVGMWKENENFSLDLQSAYGAEFAKLYNFKYATFWHSQSPVKQADYGVMKGKVTINPNVKCSPICYKKENGQVINPVGCSWDDVITLPEVRFMYRRGIGTFEMEDGIFWKQNAPVQPFKASMEKIFQQRQKGGLINKLAKRMCFSSDTDVWTECGVKKVGEVTVGDNVYSINPQTMKVSLKKVTEVNAYPYNGLMYHSHNNRHDFLVTPEHQMLVDDRHNKSLRFYQFKELMKQGGHLFGLPKYSRMDGEFRRTASLWDYVTEDDVVVVIPNKKCSSTFEKDKRFKYMHSHYRNGRPTPGRYHTSKSIIGNDPELFEIMYNCRILIKPYLNGLSIQWRFDIDDLLELLGWYVSEGNKTGKWNGSGKRPGEGICITTHVQHEEELRGLMARLGIRCNINPRKVSQLALVCRFHHKLLNLWLSSQGGEYAAGKKLPDWVFKLDSSHLDHLYKTLMLGDGTMPKKDQMLHYATISKQLASDFERLCLHLGFKTKTMYYTRVNDKAGFDRGLIKPRRPIYKIYIYKPSQTYLRTNQVTLEPYKGIVYGITVEGNHTMLVGRGKNETFEFIGQSASAWAKCIQKPSNNGINKFYSPTLALQVKTNCRLAVANFIYDHDLQSEVLHIGTDGIRTTRQVEVPNVVKMGEWKADSSDACIILSPGRVFTPTNKPQGLYLDDVVELINKNPKETYYATSKRRHLTLGEAVELNELDKVGEMRDFQTSIDLVAARLEQDMRFDDFPNSGKELISKKFFGKAVKV